MKQENVITEYEKNNTRPVIVYTKLMPNRETHVSIYCNNSDLEKLFLDNDLHKEVVFVKDTHQNTPYRVFVIDLTKDLSQISQKLIDTYGVCQKENSKLAVAILHSSSIDSEKNVYFQKMLTDLGRGKPIHRLVLTQDLYQLTSSQPITYLDCWLQQAITTKKINISEKGKNTLYPLSIVDFVQALLKTLFLASTSGKTFWILGDSFPDLEIAYLLKKHLATNNQEDLDINTGGKNETETGTQSSLGNSTRAEINWSPEKDIVDDLKQIIPIYSDPTPKLDHSEGTQNALHRFLVWAYKPRPKKEHRRFTLRLLVKRLLLIAAIITTILGLLFVIFTGASLRTLEKSIQHILSGNLDQSVKMLDQSKKYQEVGEAVLESFIPLANFLSPKETERIYNLYKFIDYGAQSMGNLHQTYVMAENFYQSLNNKSLTINYEDYSLALHSNLSQIYENLTQISFLGSENKLPKMLSDKLKATKEYQNLEVLESQVAQYIKVVDIIPKIFSEKKVVNILVLLQNSQVLRPSGGDTEHYLMLSLDHGLLKSKKYLSKSEFEKQSQELALTNKSKPKTVQPTTSISQDFSQNPNFPEYAKSLSLSFEKVEKTTPDFVLATNDTLIKQLLIEENTQSIDSFMNSLLTPEGPSVYKDLFDRYLDKLFSQQLSLPIIGRVLAKAVGENQVLLWAADPNTEQLLLRQSYSGVIAPHPCIAGLPSTNTCLAETTLLSESSQQITRQSPWSSRSVNHAVNITATSIEHEYQIEYKKRDSSLSASLVPVVYHLYFPRASTLDRVLFNSLPVSIKEVTKTSLGSLDYYQVPLALQKDQDNLVTIKTTTVSGRSLFLPLSYSLTEIRQPGTADSGFNLKITYPVTLRPSVVTGNFTSGEQQMKLTLPPHTSSFGFTLVENLQ